jgi:hypothetical protein
MTPEVLFLFVVLAAALLLLALLVRDWRRQGAAVRPRDPLPGVPLLDARVALAVAPPQRCPDRPASSTDAYPA